MENAEPIINEINSLTNNEYKFTLKSATLYENADFCVVEILYRDGIRLDKEVKQNIESKIFELLPKKIRYEIKFIKNFISEERIFDDVKLFLQKNFNSISFVLNKVIRNDMNFTIDLTIDSLAYEHASNKNLSTRIENYLKSLYEDYEYNCKISSEKVFKNDSLQELKEQYKEEDIDILKNRKIIFDDIQGYVGDEFDGPASYIIDISMPRENVVICGKIKNKKSIVLKRKPKEKDASELDSKEQDETAENKDKNESDVLQNEINLPKYERKLYKWQLEDFTGSIGCVFLSNKENQSKLEALENETEIAIFGSSTFDKYSNSISFLVKSIVLCKLPEKFEEYIEYKKEKPFYEFVNPEPLVIYQQEDLLSFSQEKKIPKYLENKTFVCFDFETTGLHYDAGDRIVEVGAVKIVNGKITEKFVSFVNPDGKHIDEGASATTGIYDEDVANAPKDYEVLQDFYKFTRGAILIGYNNINFDNVFLFGQAKKCRFNFDNQTEDVFRLAQKYVTGVKNYKLGTIAEKLGVVLDNAHSAVFDAQATAEVFLKIAEKME